MEKNPNKKFKDASYITRTADFSKASTKHGPKNLVTLREPSCYRLKPSNVSQKTNSKNRVARGGRNWSSQLDRRYTMAMLVCLLESISGMVILPQNTVWVFSVENPSWPPENMAAPHWHGKTDSGTHFSYRKANPPTLLLNVAHLVLKMIIAHRSLPSLLSLWHLHPSLSRSLNLQRRHRPIENIAASVSPV